MGCCFQDLFNTAHNILVQLTSSFFSIRIVSVVFVAASHQTRLDTRSKARRPIKVGMVHPFSRIVTTGAWKKLRFILSNRSDFYMIDSISIAIHVFARHILLSLSIDETLLPRCVNLSINFSELQIRVVMSLSWLKQMYSALPAFTWRPMLFSLE